jgi:hypothetical protein
MGKKKIAVGDRLEWRTGGYHAVINGDPKLFNQRLGSSSSSHGWADVPKGSQGVVVRTDDTGKIYGGSRVLFVSVNDINVALYGHDSMCIKRI